MIEFILPALTQVIDAFLFWLPPDELNHGRLSCVVFSLVNVRYHLLVAYSFHLVSKSLLKQSSRVHPRCIGWSAFFVLHARFFVLMIPKC